MVLECRPCQGCRLGL
ncbi:hypothetical protein MTR67_034517 [Solanum verrucosum]|uniref:Uncharacterized protein n=1 Tax=Solanum verrucosum TaxID=315347 RepID=A0AAF0ZJB7_SOLVR|nr:hypothetical protein MTR67_034517 [Solanum verrucosum]